MNNNKYLVLLSCSIEYSCTMCGQLGAVCMEGVDCEVHVGLSSLSFSFFFFFFFFSFVAFYLRAF